MNVVISTKNRTATITDFTITRGVAGSIKDLFKVIEAAEKSGAKHETSGLEFHVYTEVDLTKIVPETFWENEDLAPYLVSEFLKAYMDTDGWKDVVKSVQRMRNGNLLT